MKKLNIALFSVLFIAVAVLFYLNLSGNKKNGKNTTRASVQAQGIAFVNIDTVIYKFDMFFDRRADLMSKQKNAEAELNSKGSLYQKNANDYQDKVNKGLITRADAAEREKALYQQQQELVTLRDNLQSNLLEEEQVMNRQIVEYITSYLEANKADYNYQYILGKSFGSVVLYGDQGLDITQRVLDALNKKYKAEKK
ncbi:MAG: OmpH family outer membrane protein [Bacteroidales bacterium]